jgi:serine/threonine-protein kinase
MAPEQAAGDMAAISPATDIYGLGTILYEMLAGKPPFRASNLTEILNLVRCQPPASPRSLNPRIPAELETICLRCLNKAPHERYANAASLAKDLFRWLREAKRLPRNGLPPEGALFRGSYSLSEVA